MTRVTARIAQATLQATRAMGHESTAVLENAGIAPSLLREPDKDISCQDMVRLTNAAADQVGDPQFGLTLGLSFNSSILGPFGHVLRAAPRPRDAIETFFRFQHLLGDGLIMHHLPGLAETTIRLEATRGVEGILPRHSIEARLAGIARIIRDLATDPPVTPTRVRFRHAADPRRNEQTQIYGVDIEFGADHDEIAFRNADLDREVWGADPALFKILRRRLINDMDTSASHPPLVAHVRQHIHASLAIGRPSLAQCARACGLSARNLQRQLKAEGYSFQGLLDEVRKDVMRDLIVGEEIDISQMAMSLGFSDESAFRKACKRWFGAAPSTVRSVAQTSCRDFPG